MPVRRRIAAVHRFGPVEFWIALGNKVAVEIPDVAVGIRIDRVVRRVRVQLHSLLECLVVSRLRARVRLRQRLHRFLHQTNAHPFVVHRPDDGPVLRAIYREGLLGHPGVGLVGHLDYGRHHCPLFVAVLVIEPIAFLHDGFEILIDGVNRTRRVHPTAMLVEALIDKDLSPGHRTIGIQPLVAGHLQLRSKEEGRVRIDQQQRVARDCVRR